MKKKHLKEIERIQKSIPKELLDKLIIKRPFSPIAKEIIMRALANPKEVEGIVSAEELEKYQAMLDSGELDRTEEVSDPEIEKQIDEYYNKEFEKARKLGRLPPPQKFPKLKSKLKKS